MKTILVVEDDPLLGEMLTDCLQFAGYGTVLAEDGEDGLARLRAARPDMVLCDLHLPRLDGMGVARAMHTEPGLRATPFVLMSADHRAMVEEVHGQPTLLKPFGLHTLLETIARQIGAPTR